MLRIWLSLNRSSNSRARPIASAKYSWATSALEADQAAGGQRPRQQGRVIDLARDRQGLVSLIRAVRDRPMMAAKHDPVGERPGTHRGRYSAWCALASVRTVSNQASPSAGRGCHSGGSDDASAKASSIVRVFATPRERGAQVVDLGFGLLETLLIVAACGASSRAASDV